jgi:hypothetical protein
MAAPPDGALSRRAGVQLARAMSRKTAGAGTPSAAGAGTPSAAPAPDELAADRCSGGRDSDVVALRIGEHAERDTWYLLRRLDDPSPQLLRTLERAGDVLYADEEQHAVVSALQRTDCGRRRPVDTDVDERVARKRAVRVGPAEQLAEELAGGVGIVRANLGVNNWMGHGGLPFLDRVGP